MLCMQRSIQTFALPQPVLLGYDHSPVHSYRQIGRVLCRARVKEDTWATKSDAAVTCERCLSLLKILTPQLKPTSERAFVGTGA